MSRTQATPSDPGGTGFTLHTERLGPLPLINHFIERMAVHDVLARHVPSDRRCALTHASALGVLLRSIIVEREPIYRQQETVHGYASGMFGVSAQDRERVVKASQGANLLVQDLQEMIRASEPLLSDIAMELLAQAVQLEQRLSRIEATTRLQS